MFVSKRGFLRTALALLLSTSLAFLPAFSAQAKTVYISDETAHKEGYIIIGESHIVLTSDAYERASDENHQITGLNDIYYQWTLDSSSHTRKPRPPTVTSAIKVRQTMGSSLKGITL